VVSFQAIDQLNSTLFLSELEGLGSGRTKVYVSPRRWTKIVGILKIAATSSANLIVSLTECFLLTTLVWRSRAQIDGLEGKVAETISLVNDFFAGDHFHPNMFVDPKQVRNIIVKRRNMTSVF
jgi:hypothetical protein